MVPRAGAGRELAERLEERLTPAMSALGVLFLLVVLAQPRAEPGGFVADALGVAGWVLWAAFVLEYGVRLVLAEERLRFLRRTWWQLLFLALPFLLYQAYAFVLPAFTPRERRVAVPLMALVPVLFLAGVAFGYFVVLQRAIAFLQNFNDDDFDVLVQAREYYRFAILFLAGIGLLFQIPVGVLAVTRSGLVTPQQLRKNRGYVILAIAVIAAVATPTPDPITMTLAMGPLVILFELSILLALWLDRVRPAEELVDDDDDKDEGLDDGSYADDEPPRDDPYREG